MTNQEWIEYYRFHPSEFESFIKFCEGVVVERDNLKNSLESITEVFDKQPYANVKAAVLDARKLLKESIVFC